MDKDIHKILIDPQAILEKVKSLGRQISKDYRTLDGPIVLIGILKGSLFFLSDLSREITIPVEIESMAISSYGQSTQSSGVVRILKDLDISITGRHVLIVEGIIDTGLTLNYLLRSLNARGPKSLKVCTLIDKPATRAIEIPIEYWGFTISDEFVVGYGLDFNQQYRNLPFIGVLKPECYTALNQNPTPTKS